MSVKNSIFYMDLTHGTLFRLIKIEKNFERAVSFGMEYAVLCGIGDDRPKRVKTKKLEELFKEVSEEIKISIFDFLSKNKNEQKLPVKIVNGEIKFGNESEAFRPFKEDLFKEFEELIGPNENSKSLVSNLKIGNLYHFESFTDFSKLIVKESVINSIHQGLAKIRYQDFLTNNWKVSNSDKKSILNFYGPPGTGKTLAARAIANHLKQNILQVDYSQVESKWIGETGKNIQKAFEAATKHNAILFFDEADALVSQRNSSSSDHIQQYMNLNRNIFMQELDKFKGVVILTTNLFQNYDGALLRRISQHIEFELPDAQLREKLLRIHIPEQVPLHSDVNLTVLAEMCNGFSGGDIYNLTQEALNSALMEGESKGDMASSILQQHHLVQEADKIKKTKTTHQGKKSPIGIK